MWVRVGNDFHNLEEIAHIGLVELQRLNGWKPKECEIRATYKDGTVRVVFRGEEQQAMEVLERLDTILYYSNELRTIEVGAGEDG